MPNVFSVPIFFILFREVLEASIIVSVLLGLVEQIARQRSLPSSVTSSTFVEPEKSPVERKSSNGSGEKASTPTSEPAEHPHHLASANAPVNKGRTPEERQLIRKLRIQIFLGATIGLGIALAIGAAFIAVWYTQTKDLWGQSEDLWEGIFSLVAALMIGPMALTMLRMDHAKAKWRVKLAEAFDRKIEGDKGGRTTKYILLFLPLITVLREGLEAIVFVAGVSLGQEGSSIPLAAVVGILAGLLVGVLIYIFSDRINISYFLVFSTIFLLLIGAGLFSKAIGDFQRYHFNQLVGADVAELGDGAGSFDVRGSVWHLLYGNPENKIDGQGWSIFNAIFGWSNDATIGTILSYVFYWLGCTAALVVMKWQEGRCSAFGHMSKRGRDRHARREERQLAANHQLEKSMAAPSRSATPLHSPALEPGPKELHA